MSLRRKTTNQLTMSFIYRLKQEKDDDDDDDDDERKNEHLNGHEIHWRMETSIEMPKHEHEQQCHSMFVQTRVSFAYGNR
jgi:hypothetical protein